MTRHQILFQQKEHLKQNFPKRKTVLTYFKTVFYMKLKISNIMVVIVDFAKGGKHIIQNRRHSGPRNIMAEKWLLWWKYKCLRESI